MKALLLVLLTAVCIAPVAAGGVDSSSQKTVEAFVRAFNNHDVEGMTKLVTDDVEWFNVMGDSLTAEVRGKKALREWLTGYFASLPSVHSEMEAIMPSGSYVAIRERAIWTGKNGERSQVSIGVYEVRNGLIRHAWYFPAERDKK